MILYLIVQFHVYHNHILISFTYQGNFCCDVFIHSKEFHTNKARTQKAGMRVFTGQFITMSWSVTDQIRRKLSPGKFVGYCSNFKSILINNQT